MRHLLYCNFPFEKGTINFLPDKAFPMISLFIERDFVKRFNINHAPPFLNEYYKCHWPHNCHLAYRLFTVSYLSNCETYDTQHF